MLWQNPNREGVSSRLNYTQFSMYSLLAKVNKKSESNGRWNVALELRKTHFFLKTALLCKFTSICCCRALILCKKLTYKCEWAQKSYREKNQLISNNSVNQSPENICKFNSKVQFNLKQTFVKHFEVGSKLYLEILTLVQRYFKLEVFRKMPHLTHFGAEMVIVLLAQQKFSDKI